MKQAVPTIELPQCCLLLVCSSHEERCQGFINQIGELKPSNVIIFHYADSNNLGTMHHTALESRLRNRSATLTVQFTESEVIDNFDSQKNQVQATLRKHGENPIVVDVSVLSKRHLLLLLRWLDDNGCWDRLWLVYSEPEEYEIDGNLPLSFGISSVQQMPGFSSSPNPSRPLHAAMFLGYEGDRAFATYEILQPKKTTVIVPDPPFKDAWKGRTEEQNRNLLSAIDQYSLEKADSLDPESSEHVLRKVFGPTDVRSEFNRAICPLGTKPQTVGAYLYLRECCDPPAVIYSRPLRHNHNFYSRGIGATWLIHQPR